jgi:hypothetical protein
MDCMDCAFRFARSSELYYAGWSLRENREIARKQLLATAPYDLRGVDLAGQTHPKRRAHIRLCNSIPLK